MTAKELHVPPGECRAAYHSRFAPTSGLDLSRDQTQLMLGKGKHGRPSRRMLPTPWRVNIEAGVDGVFAGVHVGPRVAWMLADGSVICVSRKLRTGQSVANGLRHAEPPKWHDIYLVLNNRMLFHAIEQAQLLCLVENLCNNALA